MVLAGDLTDSGLPEEMEALLGGFKRIPSPVIAVLGNHDHEHDRADDLKRMLIEGGIQILDGNTFQVGEVGFAGTKGFCGGFGEGLIHLWVVENYRTGYEIVLREARSQASTEDYRQALIHCRALFKELLSEREAPH